MKSIKDIVKRIIYLEKKYDLYDFSFKGYSVWPSYRMYFFYQYAKDCNILDSSVSGFKKNISYLMKIINIFNIYKLLKKKDYFILEHPRCNKEGYDIYTYDIVQELGEKNCSFFSFSQNGVVDKRADVIILDFIKIVSKFLSKILIFLVKQKNFSSFQKFTQELNIDNNKYEKQYKRYYMEMIIQYQFYFLLLRVIKPKKVILVVSYYNMPLLFAAKVLNIETIEMQHGVISKYHLGYHFPYYKTNFFPDKLLTLGSYWNNVASYPKNSKIMMSGNNFLHEKNETSIKELNSILIISQATIGVKLANFILENINDLKSYKIYFKLHPNEFNNFGTKYTKLISYNNIYIISKEFTIDELQNFCEFQVGIYSTAIYEGIEKGCKTILLNDVGIEYMEDLVLKKYAKQIDYNNRLVNSLKEEYSSQNICFFELFKL